MTAASAGPRLRGLNLRKTFGGVRAVADVTVEVPAGQVSGLIGPNGSGKTTVMNCLSGAMKIDGGSVELDGRDVTSESLQARARRGMARTFQRMLLFNEMSALENVTTAAVTARRGSSLLDYLGAPRERRRDSEAEDLARRLLETFGVDADSAAPVRSLSYGQQRRVEIARAAATEPRALLVDEPTAGMDEREAWQVGEFLAGLAAEGAAVLLVEHNVALVKKFCVDVTVLNTGQVIARGNPHEVMEMDVVVDAYLGRAR
jgi:branched-chain amino acid transport system ATP-binding protein